MQNEKKTRMANGLPVALPIRPMQLKLTYFATRDATTRAERWVVSYCAINKTSLEHDRPNNDEMKIFWFMQNPLCCRYVDNVYLGFQLKRFEQQKVCLM